MKAYLLTKAEETSKWLRRCADDLPDRCSGCPYEFHPGCVDAILEKAAGTIDELLRQLEEPDGVLIVRTNYFLREEDREAIRRRLLREMVDGVVVLSNGLEPVFLPANVEVEIK